MKLLRDKLKTLVNPVKASLNYRNADYNLKRQFNKALKEAKGVLNKIAVQMSISMTFNIFNTNR